MDQNDKSFCLCGCGLEIKKDSHGRMPRYRVGHSGRGKHLSEEAKQKLSETNKGRSSPLKGKKRPPRSEEWCKNISLSNKGKHISTITRQKISRSLRGPKSPLWRGGITSINNKLRESEEMKRWKKSILVRDKYTCQICGERGGKLNVDHIVPFSYILSQLPLDNLYKNAIECEALWRTENGRTLCASCHKKTDTYCSHNRDKEDIPLEWKMYLYGI